MSPNLLWRALHSRCFSPFILLLCSLCATSAHGADATMTYNPAYPPSYPLAVRNPYLSTWMPGDRVKNLPAALPQFWTGDDLTWSVMARVDGQTYSLMGLTTLLPRVEAAVVREANYTGTHTVFSLSAGSVNFTLDFFSPVSPWNYLRQSLPFSYLTVSVQTSSPSEVQIYSDIDGKWTGQAQDAICEFEREGRLAMFSLSVAHEQRFKYAESRDMALWGEAIFASRATDASDLTFLSGYPHMVRLQFATQGKLSQHDPAWQTGGVVALAHDLGQVTGDRSVTFVVGYVREEAINYLGKPYTEYYRAKYSNVSSAISHFLDDYESALQESRRLDSQLITKATEVAGQKYSDIVTLSTRQAYGGIDLTIPLDTLDTDQVLAFVKEISSDGNVNTVDVIMPAFPIYWVLDPEYIRLLLEPVLRYLAQGRWHLLYAIHDIGSHYPNATGHDDQQAEPMPIEECGNLLIMILAYTQATGNTAWARQFIPVLQTYADYLVQNSVDIKEQLSTNDAAGPLANETNLAIKAAVGLKAFGQLTGLTNYSQIGEQHASLFYTDRLGTDDDRTHFVLQYPNDPSSWKIPYNLYPDVLLRLQTFPPEAYKMAETFFISSTSSSHSSSVRTQSRIRGEYGVALDNRLDWAKSDWNMWTAGTFAPDSPARAHFVDDLWAFMTNQKHNWPFSDRYVSRGPTAGVPLLCRARPTVGGHFALLALRGPHSLSLAPYMSNFTNLRVALPAKECEPVAGDARPGTLLLTHSGTIDFDESAAAADQAVLGVPVL